MATSSKATELLAQHLLQQQSKNPELAAKQRRLLETLSADTSLQQQDGSSDSSSTAATPGQPQPSDGPKTPASPTASKLPPAPMMSQFASRNEYEEALGRWRATVGKILALAGQPRLPDSRGS